MLALGAQLSPGCGKDTETSCMAACKMSPSLRPAEEQEQRARVKIHVCARTVLSYISLHLI